MDPLSALSLAAAIAQFIDYGSKIVSQTKEIADLGSSVNVQHLSTITNDIKGINSSLKRQLKVDVKSSATLSQEALDLQSLAIRCNEIAQELVECLTKVTITGDKKDTWTSIRAAIKTVWTSQQIATLSQRLNDYRSQLTLRLLLVINSQHTLQDKKLDKLSRSNGEIVEAVTISLGTLQSAINDQNNKLNKRHAETIAAILTTRGGDSRTITGSSTSIFESNPSTDQRVATTFKQATAADVSTKPHSSIETREFTDFTQRILDALHFQSISDRRAAIPMPHTHTFEWIFKKPSSLDTPWDSLDNWLRQGKGCYWINGKAGSGKSTLMKYIEENKKTRAALNHWAGPSKLITGSFFFWYAGSTMQKSQEGLLRSLLLDVLTQQPQLVPTLFPEAYRTIIACQHDTQISLSFSELKRAFLNLIASVPKGLKICYLIDGVDEYLGDHNEIAELFQQATASESVKILLSSRPIPACFQAFSNCSTLRLQDLTQQDIRHYVYDELAQNPLMLRLEAAETGCTSRLVDGITKKAAGVVLWVVLVVRNLRSGLQDYDNSAELQRKLDELPPTLEKLYGHMLGSMSSHHRQQGSKLLQMVLRSIKTHGDFPLTVLQLSFAEEDDYTRALSVPIKQITEKDAEWRCEVIEGRLRSRCCGLIEVHDRRCLRGAGKARKSIGFLHRTAIEFLQGENIWTDLVSLTSETKFDVNLALFSSALWEMKVTAGSSCNSGERTSTIESLLRIMSYERYFDTYEMEFATKYLPHVRRTMYHHWAEFRKTDALDLSTIEAATANYIDRLGMAFPVSFMFFAASQCPSSHLQALFVLYRDPFRKEESDEEQEILDYGAVSPSATPQMNPIDVSIATDLLLLYLDKSMAPLRSTISQNILGCWSALYATISPDQAIQRHWNQRWREVTTDELIRYSIWDYTLHTAFTISRYNEDDFEELYQYGLVDSFFDLIIDLLEKQCSISTTISVASDNRRMGDTGVMSVSAAAVLNELISRAWKRQVWKPDPTQQKEKLDKITEKACAIENKMKGTRAYSEYTVQVIHKEPRIEESLKSRLKRLSLKQKSPPPTSASTPVASTRQEKKIVYHDSESEISPWRKYITSSEDDTIVTSTPEQRDEPDAKFMKRWKSTPRATRISLLYPEEQELARLLSLPGNNREGRLALGRVRKMPLAKQELILECAGILKG
ncbi:P-loop containing nucleoside triphosphate hydrolase [Glarea lozoyensis ATCC 20868]|uniref:p-loop containing nucleoside triphosphate hydrolase n=1 Tax=Glarea lozoyensis (strain ATCC 20868 / MF5171) TaxID=1116229 RepID=S3DFI7_GLAL2|nr:P-loop containing nucleoside triphosphate hydrolase [Glarea lozoyensis ATCC 20868]EPE25403.1 P-loop containing nucleoside triphosphate hydrolase [Glarea lozoyensis ATCC 20868]